MLYFIKYIDILFMLTKDSIKVKEIEKIEKVEIKLESSLKQEVKNFVTSGKIVKV